MEGKYLGCKQCIKEEREWRPFAGKVEGELEVRHCEIFGDWPSYKTLEDFFGNFACPHHATLLEYIYNIKNEDF